MPPESLHIGPSVGSEGNLVDAQGWISIVVAVVIVIDENVAVGICRLKSTRRHPGLHMGRRWKWTVQR